MSCPTFWENFGTEVTWSSLSFTAGGIILAAQACYTLDDEEGVIKLANKYQELFIDFEQSFQGLVEEYSFAMELLYAQLREICKRRGIDFEYEIAKMSSKLDTSAFEKKVGELAEKIYHSVFSTYDVSLLVTDINKQLILSKAFAIRGKPNIAKQFFTEAKFFEWKKSISSTMSKYPIPVRVGVLHAKHFPNFQRLFKLPLTEIEVDTEIIIGEAHAYSP
jgi:hypothetical protein